MKFGQRLEEQSVPEWSIHNVDYNTLKHQIKTHTTKAHAATAITIPGQQDQALQKFEEAFYHELCRQHDRVCFFVSSKCDEIHWRLRHISDQLNRLILQCTDDRGLTGKRQRRLTKYRQQINECGDDINALSRFVGAQVVAFRKILKKYKKWTRSITLGSRFRDNVLSSPKSFTNRDLSALRTQVRDVLATLQAATSGLSSPLQPRSPTSRPASPGGGDTQSRRGRSRRSRTPTPAVTAPPGPPIVYWNEYDHGSEAGDYGDDTYAIYIDPNETTEFPGFHYLRAIMAAPSSRIRRWLKGTGAGAESLPTSTSDTQSLLHHGGSPRDYFSIRKPRPGSSTDNEGTEDGDGYVSSSAEDAATPAGLRKYERRGQRASNSTGFLSTLEEADDGQQQQQGALTRMAEYRDRVLARSVVLFFALSFALLLVSGVLVATGRHKLRLEVDAGATVGSVASLFCACMGLGALFARPFPPNWLYALAVWAAFAAAASLNGMLLVIVVRSTGI
ncbi:hypothetical protein SLS62_001890 [Diatrype stigma]|uniref:SPX domain-containing protein n=1 Tax=Diatrype stigma TaxID=117547 RepID=A0AAN9V9E2_9PEZI